MNYSIIFNRSELILFLICFCFLSCRNQSIDIIKFEATTITPGRSEQNKFTSYSLKFVNKDDTLLSNSIRIIYNDELEITPVKLNQNSKAKFLKGDTIQLAFSTQNKFQADQSYFLKYKNERKTKHKKLRQPDLKIKTNTPN